MNSDCKKCIYFSHEVLLPCAVRPTEATVLNLLDRPHDCPDFKLLSNNSNRKKTVPTNLIEVQKDLLKEMRRAMLSATLITVACGFIYNVGLAQKHSTQTHNRHLKEIRERGGASK